MPYVSANPATAATAVSLIAAQDSNYKISVDSLFISSDTAQTITLSDRGSAGTATVWKQYVAANGGLLSSDRNLFQCTAANALTYTTSAAGNAFIAVKWHKEKANPNSLPST